MHVDLAPFLDSWPAENVSAALIGTRTGTYGDEGRVYELASVTKLLSAYGFLPVSYTHLTLPTTLHECRSRWSPYH